MEGLLELTILHFFLPYMQMMAVPRPFSHNVGVFGYGLLSAPTNEHVLFLKHLKTFEVHTFGERYCATKSNIPSDKLQQHAN